MIEQIEVIRNMEDKLYVSLSTSVAFHFFISFSEKKDYINTSFSPIQATQSTTCTPVRRMQSQKYIEEEFYRQ